MDFIKDFFLRLKLKRLVKAYPEDFICRLPKGVSCSSAFFKGKEENLASTIFYLYRIKEEYVYRIGTVAVLYGEKPQVFFFKTVEEASEKVKNFLNFP